MILTELVLKDFRAEDYPAFKQWFADETLDRTLGPIDEEWLEHVLHDDEGKQLSVFQADQLVGVVGLLGPDSMDNTYYITDIAVQPDRKQTGIGTQILRELYGLTGGNRWACYVDRENEPAQRFFAKNGWRRGEVDADDMIKYEFSPARQE